MSGPGLPGPDGRPGQGIGAPVARVSSPGDGCDPSAGTGEGAVSPVGIAPSIAGAGPCAAISPAAAESGFVGNAGVVGGRPGSVGMGAGPLPAKAAAMVAASGVPGSVSGESGRGVFTPVAVLAGDVAAAAVAPAPSRGGGVDSDGGMRASSAPPLRLDVASGGAVRSGRDEAGAASITSAGASLREGATWSSTRAKPCAVAGTPAGARSPGTWCWVGVGAGDMAAGTKAIPDETMAATGFRLLRGTDCCATPTAPQQQPATTGPALHSVWPGQDEPARHFLPGAWTGSCRSARPLPCLKGCPFDWHGGCCLRHG